VLPQFSRLLSVEEAGVWKPARRAYVYGLATCGVEPAEALLVAVHPWDIEGASRAGLQTAWLDRQGASYPTYLSEPTMRIASLPELADRLR
jgi:2-haloacid dehalogenase